MRSFIAILIVLASSQAFAAEQKVVDPKGKTIGLILDCNSCKDPEKGENCTGGVPDGYHDGKRCGECLIAANYGTRLLYAYDLYFSGKLQQPDGQPLVNEFVRLYLPNTWTVRTRTTEEGFYRLVLGATQERAGSQIEVDLGTRKRAKSDGAVDYALYMLPENYKECPAEK